jgi:hypothetical protein
MDFNLIIIMLSEDAIIVLSTLIVAVIQKFRSKT